MINILIKFTIIIPVIIIIKGLIKTLKVIYYYAISDKLERHLNPNIAITLLKYFGVCLLGFCIAFFLILKILGQNSLTISDLINEYKPEYLSLYLRFILHYILLSVLLTFVILLFIVFFSVPSKEKWYFEKLDDKNKPIKCYLIRELKGGQILCHYHTNAGIARTYISKASLALPTLIKQEKKNLLQIAKTLVFQKHNEEKYIRKIIYKVGGFITPIGTLLWGCLSNDLSSRIPALVLCLGSIYFFFPSYRKLSITKEWKKYRNKKAFR